MRVSAQSKAVLADLLGGRTVKSTDNSVSVGPLSGNTASLLRVLMGMYEDLEGRSGEDQAQALIRGYQGQRKADTEATKGQPTATPSESGGVAGAKPTAAGGHWRIMSICCSSIRGLAPAGEEFEFSVGGQPALIYGPNGSGKSSLLSAVSWILTNQPLTDSPSDDEMAPIYSVSPEEERGQKVREWPIVVTLPPHELVRSADPSCWAQIALKQLATGRELELRRTLGAGLEVREAGGTWVPCDDLRDVSITPLDVQLSVVAPTIFGRQSIETAQNTRDILSLMLGFDDLGKLGDLSSKASGNRTRYAKARASERDQLWGQIRERLATQVLSLPDQTPLQKELVALAAMPSPTAEKIVEFGKKVASAIEDAEQRLATLLGVGITGGKAPAGVADALTVAVGRLESDLWAMFPRLGALRPSVAFPGIAADQQEAEVARLAAGVSAFLLHARGRIQDRLVWWRKENAPGSKVSLLVRASKFYDQRAGTCPVCNQDVGSLPVARELASLKDTKPDLEKDVSVFFADLQKALLEIVPGQFCGLSVSASDRLREDWEALRAAILAPPFESLASSPDARIAALANSLQLPDIGDMTLLPSDSEETFLGAASSFSTAVEAVLRSLGNLQWAADEMGGLAEKLRKAICDPSAESGSLLSQFSRGKAAAAQVTPLAVLREALRGVNRSRTKIAELDALLGDLEELRGSLDSLKLLSKYAAAQVSQVFTSIRDAAVGHWAKMYPESSTGMKPGRLVLGTGRDKTVEALLSLDKYEVPGQFFANAGLQRAIALAFYFALLERHPRGLEFILLDDPILSLDEDHRERWSQDVLYPKLAEFQVILATHQRQYITHCGHHFPRESVFELNPRDHSQRVSWRPGHEIGWAKSALVSDWRSCPNILRKYRERVLLTFDAYSHTPFFDAHNLTKTFDRYRGYSAPHPLGSKGQRKIVAHLEDPRVSKIVDAGSHALTDGSITRPMVEDCLALLEECQGFVETEIRRLEGMRDRARRTVAVPCMIGEFPGLPEGASWDTLEMSIMGRAAARSGPWSVEVAEAVAPGFLRSGTIVGVAGDSIDPIARAGQWVILASGDVTPRDGDLVAAVDEDDNRLLRRLWSVDGSWVLQATNPIRPIPCRLVKSQPLGLRRVVGVLYGDGRPVPPIRPDRLQEWAPLDLLAAAELGTLKAIAVEGTSLDPIAKRGQWVLVRSPLGDAREVEQGGLAAVATEESGVGNVLKRVFMQGKTMFLVSPNPVDVLPPSQVSIGDVRSVWPFAGVLFEGMSTGSL